MILISNLTSKDFRLLLVSRSLSKPYRLKKRNFFKNIFRILSTIFD